MRCKPRYIWQNDDWISPKYDYLRIEPHLLECHQSLLDYQTQVRHSGISRDLKSWVKMIQIDIENSCALGDIELDTTNLRPQLLQYFESSNHDSDPLIDLFYETLFHSDKLVSSNQILFWYKFLSSSPMIHSRIKNQAHLRSMSYEIVSTVNGIDIVHYTTPPSLSVSRNIHQLVKWLDLNLCIHDPLILAAIAYFFILSIYPFDYGNDIIARAVSYSFLSLKYEPILPFLSFSNQIIEDIEEYNQILEHCQIGICDVTDWIIWFLSMVQRSVRSSEGILEKEFKRAEINQLLHETTIPDRSYQFLQIAIERGFEINTRKYAEVTQSSRATAYRDLEQLSLCGILKRFAKGRGSFYKVIQRRGISKSF